ncbi:hypothetical protein [PinkBerry-associated phage LS06-2018-MD08]|nr:hypothetical protein [PinkBerry-associated phage LS06-2018-MD08]
MRRRIQKEFLHKGYLLKKSFGNNNSVSYSEIGLLFKYDNYQDKKSVIQGEEIMGNWQSTDEGRRIVTNSSHTFNRDDRVVLDGNYDSPYIISNIEVEEDSRLKKGAIRNRKNVNTLIITLT